MQTSKPLPYIPSSLKTIKPQGDSTSHSQFPPAHYALPLSLLPPRIAALTDSGHCSASCNNFPSGATCIYRTFREVSTVSRLREAKTSTANRAKQRLRSSLSNGMLS